MVPEGCGVVRVSETDGLGVDRTDRWLSAGCGARGRDPRGRGWVAASAPILRVEPGRPAVQPGFPERLIVAAGCGEPGEIPA